MCDERDKAIQELEFELNDYDMKFDNEIRKSNRLINDLKKAKDQNEQYAN